MLVVLPSDACMFSLFKKPVVCFSIIHPVVVIIVFQSDFG